MTNPKPLKIVDIVITIFNQEKLIERVLYGIFKNTTTPFNLIIVFDGCTDRTETRAIKYIKNHKPKNLRRIIIETAPNVYETRANNIGFRLAKSDYILTLQDDMVIREKGWERRLTFPLRAHDNVLATTARIAQDIKDITKHKYINRAGKELGTLARNTFSIRDVINRGPNAFRMDYLRKLNYLNENYAPCDLDDADLSLRAWEQFGLKVGVFTIDYLSPGEWSKARAKDSTMEDTKSIAKNVIQIAVDHAKYLSTNKKHTEDIIIEESEIDYLPDNNLPIFIWYTPYLLPQTIKIKLHKIGRGLKTFGRKLGKFPLYYLVCFFFKIPLDVIKKNGLKNSLSTDVGLANGSNREIWLEKTLRSLPDQSTILDAGAGELQYKKFCSHLKYTSQDFGQYDGRGTKEGLQMEDWDNSKLDIVSDITKIPVPDNSFEAIMCVEVFEHIPEPAKAVKEFSRIIKPGGKLILTVPFCSLNHFAPYYFANGYSRYWYEKILPEYGFEIEKIEANGNYFEYMAQEIRRLPKVQFSYSSLNLTNKILYKLSSVYLLTIMDKLSRTSKNSEELLCFGYHLLATKK